MDYVVVLIIAAGLGCIPASISGVTILSIYLVSTLTDICFFAQFPRFYAFHNLHIHFTTNHAVLQYRKIIIHYNFKILLKLTFSKNQNRYPQWFRFAFIQVKAIPYNFGGIALTQ